MEESFKGAETSRTEKNQYIVSRRHRCITWNWVVQ